MEAVTGQKPRVELLAPAGNRESFMGAIHAGADAVYLGGNRFGARAYADNFATEELTECIRYAHLWGRKVYLTVNTLVKENEFSDLYPYLFPFYEAGLDGVIVQDIGVLSYIREHFPDLELHASTQMTLSSEYGAALLKEMGVCRIVPSRELGLKELIRIKERTGLSIECFIHGAMCYCYSGQCLFSSILGGRSGNRGRCAQPCRLPYTVEFSGSRSGECHPLSLKDMCTIEHIPELIEAGIDSFKIEGRMKKPEYAAGVTAIYRKYIDRYYESFDRMDTWRVEEADLQALSGLYIRSERQDGYYHKHHGRDMVTLDNPSYGKSDEALLERIRQNYLLKRPHMPICVKASFKTGNPARVTFFLKDLETAVEGEMVQTAANRPITKENLERQLGKLGESIFEVEQMEIAVSDDAFYALGAVNELRREAVRRLEDMLISENGLSPGRDVAYKEQKESSLQKTSRKEQGDVAVSKGSGDDTGRLNLSLRTGSQLTAALKYGLQEQAAAWGRVYIDGDLLCGEMPFSSKEADQNLEACRRLSKRSEVIIALPYVIRAKDTRYLDRVLHLLTEYPDVFAGVMARSLDEIGWFCSLERGNAWKCYGDAGLYVWNRETLKVWKETLDGFCLPLELKSQEQRCLTEGMIPCEKVIYGRIPMMITANCVVNTTLGCRRDQAEEATWLTDRYRKRFPVERNCTHCMNIIYNSVPLSLHGELAKWNKRADLRIDLTVEDERESGAVLTYFTGLQAAGYPRADAKPPFLEYTTGHERRGVE